MQKTRLPTHKWRIQINSVSLRETRRARDREGGRDSFREKQFRQLIACG